MGYESFQSILNVSKNSKIAVPKKIVEALLDPGPDLIVCDEGHLIKNGTINRTKTLAKVKTKRRIILTGTPMQNNLVEYYYMVDFVKPNLLGTRKEFNNRFVNPIINGGYEDSTDADIRLMRKRSHVLHEYLKDTIQRYDFSELIRYLPQKLDYVVFVRLHPLQADLYKSCMEIGGVIGMERTKTFFHDYLKLRDIWTHPCILLLKQSQQTKRKEVDTIVLEPEIQDEVPSEWWRSRVPNDITDRIDYGPKMKILFEIISQSLRLNDKVLIFGSHLSELDAIECFLNNKGWEKEKSYLRMDGTVSPDKRMQYCNKFNKSTEIKLFLLSQKIGGLGLNLVGANRIVLMDVNFNPAIDNQSLFRSYRFGQEKRIYVYRLVSIGTMEEVIYERSITKQAVSLRVVDEHQITRHFTSNDLQALYRFKTYDDEPRPKPKRPADDVLAAILNNCEKEVFKYQNHQDLLENRPEEQLNEEEQRLAWYEFRKEQEAMYQNARVPNPQVESFHNIDAIPSTSASIAIPNMATPLSNNVNVSTVTRQNPPTPAFSYYVRQVGNVANVPKRKQLPTLIPQPRANVQLMPQSNMSKPSSASTSNGVLKSAPTNRNAASVASKASGSVQRSLIVNSTANPWRFIGNNHGNQANQARTSKPVIFNNKEVVELD